MKKIAIMTAGGDCAGLNSAIKSIVMTAKTQGIGDYRSYGRIYRIC